MTNEFKIREIQQNDYAQWLPLWDGYNAFYGRSGATALPEEITKTTWERFFNSTEPVFALVAEDANGALVGLVHYLFHRNTTRINDVCYLNDLFTDQAHRGRGVARQLILSVYDEAKKVGSNRVYWTTHTTNEAGRVLYDKVAKHLGFIVYSQEI